MRMREGTGTVFTLRAERSDRAERGLFGLQVLRRRSKPVGPDIANQHRKNVSRQANTLFPAFPAIWNISYPIHLKSD